MHAKKHMQITSKTVSFFVLNEMFLVLNEMYFIIHVISNKAHSSLTSGG